MTRHILSQQVVVLMVCYAVGSVTQTCADDLVGDDKRSAGDVRDDNELKMKLVWCPAGSFRMGSPEGVGVPNDTPQKDVTLTQGFWMGMYEVTQKEWNTLMKTDRWSGPQRLPTGDDYAAETMTWEEATEFCERLTQQERKAGRLSADWQYTLPTEAQWEYACRAGTTTRFFFGDDINELGDYVWFRERIPHPVGQKKPNAWGLHDTSGGVWEWCRDWYLTSPAAGTDPFTDKPGPKGKQKSLRGSCYNYDAKSARVSCRDARRTGSSAKWYPKIGFRVALVKAER